MNTRLLSILPFAIFVSSLITGCFPKEENFTLLTEQGRTELGVTKLTLQCQPGNNGLSIDTKEDGILSPIDGKISFFTNQNTYAFKRIINNKVMITIYDGDKTLDERLTKQLTKSLNGLCNEQYKQETCNCMVKPSPDSTKDRIIYRFTPTGKPYSENMGCQNWEKSAIYAFETLRSLSNKLRTKQSSRHPPTP